MSNEELNRKISEARGPKPEPRGITFGTTNPIPWHMDQIWTGTWQPRDWTGSEDASAVLLEEMGSQRNFVLRSADDVGGWCCYFWDSRETHSAKFMDVSIHLDRKTAIALAWLKWKAIP